jgi:hypothetical protein
MSEEPLNGGSLKNDQPTQPPQSIGICLGNSVLDIERSSVPRTLDAWVEGYKLAWENRDAEAVAALFTADATYRSNIFEDAHLGRAGVKAYWESVTSSQSDVRCKWEARLSTAPGYQWSFGRR